MSTYTPNLKKKMALETYRAFRALKTKKHDLTYLFWECTLRCNLDCVHCGSDCTRDAAHPDMPLGDFLNVLDSIGEKVEPQKILIVLTGGEPLLRQDLEEAGREFSKRGHQWGMVTNGFAMTEKRFQALLESGLKSMTVSLDGLNDSHNKFRGRNKSFERAMNAIKMAANTPGLTFDVVTCVNQENIHELPELRCQLIDAGIKRWRIATVFPKGRAKENPMLQLDNDQFRYVFEFIKETRNQGYIRASYGCEGYLGSLEGQVRDVPFFCRAGVNIGSVLVDGSISACPSLRADYIQGNIYKDDYLDIWDNKFQIMRDRSWAKTGECKDCDSWKYCKGNGLHLRDEKSGELLTCHLKRLQG